MGEKLVIGGSTILLCMRLVGVVEEVSPEIGDEGLDLKNFS